MIPIVDLSPNAASLTRPLPSGDKITFLQYICTEIQALSIQPTSRTDDLGKWLVVVEKNKKMESEKYLDTKMPELFKVEFSKESCMGGFTTPQRTSVLVHQSTYGAYEESLRNMSRESEKILVVQTKKHGENRKRYILWTTKMHFRSWWGIIIQGIKTKPTQRGTK